MSCEWISDGSSAELMDGLAIWKPICRYQGVRNVWPCSRGRPSQYMQKEFGVTASQAAASGYADYTAHGGANAAGFGFSATWFITQHWLINTDAAVNQLVGSASESPLTQAPAQRIVALSMAYRW